MPAPILKELILKEALKYNTPGEFNRNNPNMYSSAYKRGFLDEACKHMAIDVKKIRTFDEIKTEALKYDYIIDFRNNNHNFYDIARKKGWLDEICSHMERKHFNLSKRLIYSYEFSDNHVYIGLTYDIENRQKHRDRFENDPVTKHSLLTNLKPIRKILTELLSIEDAILKEEYFLNNYINNGWIILNKAKTGGLGGNKSVIKWTKEKCLLEAKKYKSKSEWHKKQAGSQLAAKKIGNDFYIECCSHMENKITKWTKEKCKETSILFNSRRLFEKTYPACYRAAKRFGDDFFEECCSHMTKTNYPKHIIIKKHGS